MTCAAVTTTNRRNAERVRKMKIVLWICLIITAVAAAKGASSDIGAPLLMIDTVVFIVYLLTRKKKRKIVTPEEQERREHVAQAQQEYREKCAEIAQANRERKIANNTIVSTAIVSTTSKGKQKASVTSSIVRASVGGLVSPGWALVGALTPKKTTVTKDTKVTFAILYASGKRSVETVKVGSKRYNELAKYIA